jgi:hypothetical protein
MSTRHREKEAPFRWRQWQQHLRTLEVVPADAARRDYTLLKVRPSLRPAFFAALDLWSARVHFEDRLPQLLHEVAVVQALPDAQAAWIAWQQWTRRLAAYLERLATGREGTLPPVPAALATLLDTLEVPDGS